MGLHTTVDDFTTMPKEIVCIMEWVFSMRPISNDTYTNFIILHSFSELQDIQFSIQDQLKMASKESLALTILNYLHGYFFYCLAIFHCLSWSMGKFY